MTLDELITQRDNAELASIVANNERNYLEGWRQELIKDTAALQIATMLGASAGTIARARAAVKYSKDMVWIYESMERGA